jgi:hypothetical protein
MSEPALDYGYEEQIEPADFDWWEQRPADVDDDPGARRGRRRRA